MICFRIEIYSNCLAADLTVNFQPIHSILSAGHHPPKVFVQLSLIRRQVTGVLKAWYEMPF